MMNGSAIKLEPILSCELVNPAADKLFKAFEKGFEILYIYGGPGVGKSLAVSMLVEENNMVLHYLKDMPNSKLEVEALSRHNSLMDTRVVAVVADDIDRFSAKEIDMLVSVPWKFNKLILIGSAWKRSKNPLLKVSKNKKIKFVKVKYDDFKEDVIVNVLLRLALKYKTSMTLEERVRIAKASDGDLRKAMNATKNYLISGKRDLDSFIPNSEATYFNKVKRMFSGNYTDALEEVESFGWYYSVMIIQRNLEGRKNGDDLMELLMKISMSKMQNRERYLALMACEMQKRYGKGPYPKWYFPSKAKKVAPSNVQAVCGEIKKYLYFI